MEGTKYIFPDSHPNPHSYLRNQVAVGDWA